MDGICLFDQPVTSLVYPWGRRFATPVAPYTEDFETSLGSWVNDPGNTASNWRRLSGSTPSTGTGPSGAYSGSYYIYLETSSYAVNVTDIIMYTITEEDATLTEGTITFAVHRYGSTLGTTWLEGYTEGVWNYLWHSAGNKGNQWFVFEIPFLNVTKLRFRNLSAAGNYGDVALDNIIIT